jgi:hypothetical protein
LYDKNKPLLYGRKTGIPPTVHFKPTPNKTMLCLPHDMYVTQNFTSQKMVPKLRSLEVKPKANGFLVTDDEFYAVNKHIHGWHGMDQLPH